MSSKVMTMQGAPLTLGSGWDWSRILGVVAGSGMIVGGGIWAFKGFRREKKWWLYSGLGLAGVGALTILAAWWMARQTEQALQTQPGMTTPPFRGTTGRVGEGDVVLLGDGERGKVVTVDDLADGTQQLSVEIHGSGGDEERVVNANDVRVL